MQYNQYREEQTELVSESTCFCLPLRSGVLAIGLIGATLAISGMVAYAIVQVPTIRVHVGQYFTNTTVIEVPEEQDMMADEDYKFLPEGWVHVGQNFTNTTVIEVPEEQDMMADEDYKFRKIAYTSEIVGAVVGTSLGLLVNILLIFGVLWRRRWFFMHWLVFHIIALVLLFITSILVFVVQVSLWKLIGIVPVLVAIFTMYCWAKVYELFCSLYPLPEHHDNHQPPCRVHPFMLPAHHTEWIEELDRKEREVSMDQIEELGPGVEFYPVDSLSRGMVDKRRVFNRTNMVYLPYDDMDDLRGIWNNNDSREQYQPNHEYQPSSGSTASSIVQYQKESEGDQDKHQQ